MENKTGLWKKVSQKGNEYFAGKIKLNGKEYKITLFENKNKTNEKQPDFNLILKTDVENNNTATDEKVYEEFGKTTYEIKDEDIAF